MAVTGFGKEIASPFENIVDSGMAHFVEHSLVDSFDYMAEKIVDSMDFVVDRDSIHYFEVAFGKDMADFDSYTVAAIECLPDLGASFAPSIHN
ncbi:hypothetical protein ABES03_13290 [Neobacillus rhizosphaerae]|uniref:hypothetical protein n=1 Tax=Neobacillus rhizosphaerae TaxID=2880965 RepID=UPI003D269106